MKNPAVRLPPPPKELSFEDVALAFEGIDPGNPVLGFVPFYRFRIRAAGFNVGKLNFRVGQTAHVRLYVGHIGYEVHEPFRGHRFAWKACRAVAPVVRLIYRSVIITSDPENTASVHTITRLGALFLEEVAVPPIDSQYLAGSRRKWRYQWTPDRASEQAG